MWSTKCNSAPKPTFWTQIPKLNLLPRKGPGHSASFSSTVLPREDPLCPRPVGACDHPRHMFVTPHLGCLHLPLLLSLCCSFTMPRLSCSQAHLRPAGFAVTSEPREWLVWDEALAAPGPLIRRPVAQALHPGAGEVMLLSSSCLTFFLPMAPAGPFSLLEPVGSCLASAELIRSSALSVPYQALWGKRARGAFSAQGSIRVPSFPAGPACPGFFLAQAQ